MTMGYRNRPLNGEAIFRWGVTIIFGTIIGLGALGFILEAMR